MTKGTGRRRSPWAAGLSLVLLAGACKARDPKQELEVKGLETYWAIDAPSGTKNFMAPVLRLTVHNKGGRPQPSVDFTATFRRLGDKSPDSAPWSAWERIATARKPLGTGQETLVVLKSEGHYTLFGPPEQMFKNPGFKPVRVEAFARVGASQWVKVAEADVEDRIGSRSVAPDSR